MIFVCFVGMVGKIVRIGNGNVVFVGVVVG